MPIIKAQNIGLKINQTIILDKVSFTIEQADFVGLIGPNGAGKTSLLKIILNIIKPTTGKIAIDPAVRIGYVPQQYLISPVVPISVGEVLLMSGSPKDICHRQLQRVGLSDVFWQRNFHQLSGGQQQRVVIARALAQEPNVLIFDEPLNGVDHETKQSLYQLLEQLNTKDQMTILFVSHEVEHIVSNCHCVLCLDKTLHQGCHPIDFANGQYPCQTCDSCSSNASQSLRVHHHH